MVAIVSSTRPSYDLFVWDGVLRDVGAVIPCNWLQIMENSSCERQALRRAELRGRFVAPAPHHRVNLTGGPDRAEVPP